MTEESGGGGRSGGSSSNGGDMPDSGLLDCLRAAAAEHGARTGMQARVEATPSGAVKAYGPSSSPLNRALDGLSDVRELSYTAAEHHPFWPLLYHAADVTEAVLERWDGDRRLGPGEIDEMRWSLGVMMDTLDRLAADAGGGGGGGGGGASTAPAHGRRSQAPPAPEKTG